MRKYRTEWALIEGTERALIDVVYPSEEQQIWQKVTCFKFSIILFITPKLKIYVGINIKQFVKEYPVASFIWGKSV